MNMLSRILFLALFWPVSTIAAISSSGGGGSSSGGGSSPMYTKTGAIADYQTITQSRQSCPNGPGNPCKQIYVDTIRFRITAQPVAHSTCNFAYFAFDDYSNSSYVSAFTEAAKNKKIVKVSYQDVESYCIAGYIKVANFVNTNQDSRVMDTDGNSVTDSVDAYIVNRYGAYPALRDNEVMQARTIQSALRNYLGGNYQAAKNDMESNFYYLMCHDKLAGPLEASDDDDRLLNSILYNDQLTNAWLALGDLTNPPAVVDLPNNLPCR